MPMTKTEVTSSAHVDVPTALDSAGAEVRIGDTVTVSYKVTGIRCLPDPETGGAGKDVLELGLVKPNGYVAHMGALESTLVKKV